IVQFATISRPAAPSPRRWATRRRLQTDAAFRVWNSELLVQSRTGLGLAELLLAGGLALGDRLGRRGLLNQQLLGHGREDDHLDAAVQSAALVGGVVRQRLLIGIANHRHAEAGDAELVQLFA